MATRKQSGQEARSVAREGEEIRLASSMIELGARLQVLQAETSLSYDRLARLYREIRGCSPPKGMLPFSVDWFMTWQPNIHSTMFYSIYRFLADNAGLTRSLALIRAYRLYLEHAQSEAGGLDTEPVLSFTRAWMLIRYVECGELQMSSCSRCSGGFLTHAFELNNRFVCVICKPPPRAGKSRLTKGGVPAQAAVRCAREITQGA